MALDGRRYNASLPDNITVAAAPVFGGREVAVRGAVIVRAEPPPALTHAFDELRGDRLRALMIAIVIGVLVGFLASSLIAIRIRRLAAAAEQMAAGGFDAPLPRRRRRRDRRPDPLARHDARRSSARRSACSPPSATASRRSSTG